jgi:lipid-A-disaccharide synthase
MVDAPLFFLIAGEASGDLLGARLMQGLKKKTDGQVRFAGIGGPRMRAEGIDLLFPQEELAHMGFFELLRHIPRILGRIKQTVAAVKRMRPVALVTIDSPDFSFRVARALKGQGIPLIHYVAPSVWAWRPGRAKKVAQFLDHLLALLPFEPPYFTKEGLACTFVGHSIVESGAGAGSGARFRAKYNIPENAELLTVLPGSRIGIIGRLLPIFGETVARLKTRHPHLQVIIPSISSLVPFIKEQTAGWDVPVTVIESDADKYDAFAASRAALACSGTVAVELALARLPTVVAYKVSWLSGCIARAFLKVKYASLVNLMHDKMLVPECLQNNCTPEKLTEALCELLDNEVARKKQIEGLSDVAGWLGQGHFVPSERAAEVVLDAARTKRAAKAA